jgi:O-antigen chain-terminating methyltransferase
VTNNITGDDLVRLFRSEALKRSERPPASAEPKSRLRLPPLQDLPAVRDLPLNGAAEAQTVVSLSHSIEQMHADLAALRSALRPLIEDFQLRSNDLTEQLYRGRYEATEQWEAAQETRWDLMNLAEDFTTTAVGTERLHAQIAQVSSDVADKAAAASGEFSAITAGLEQLRSEIAQVASEAAANTAAAKTLRGETAAAMARIREAETALETAIEARATAADRATATANERVAEVALEITRSGQASAEALGRLEDRLDNEAAYLKAQLSRLTALLDNVKRPASKSAARGAKAPAETAAVDADTDAFYLAFENAFRGKRSEIKARLAVYLPFLEAATVSKGDGAILDLGCGRGEWLQVLKEQKYRHAAGVDLNVSMVEQCTSRGLEVVRADAIEHLRSQKDASLSAVTSFHLIEHLAFRDLMAFLHEIYRVLKPGGLVILETPNPRNILVGASDFFRDLTHNHPIHPDTIRFTLETIGFANTRCYFLGDTENGRRAIPEKEFVFPDLQSYVDVPRDFAVIGRKA